MDEYSEIIFPDWSMRVYTGLKLGVSREGKITGWEGTGRRGECLDLRRTMWQKNGESFIMKTSIILLFTKIIIQLRIKGSECSTHRIIG